MWRAAMGWLVRWWDRLSGNEATRVPVPDWQEIREEELRRAIRMERQREELERLKSERAKRESKPPAAAGTGAAPGDGDV